MPTAQLLHKNLKGVVFEQLCGDCDVGSVKVTELLSEITLFIVCFGAF